MVILDPTNLAWILGVSDKTLRSWLRQEFPKKAPGKGNRWTLNLVMARRMAERAKNA